MKVTAWRKRTMNEGHEGMSLHVASSHSPVAPTIVRLESTPLCSVSNFAWSWRTYLCSGRYERQAHMLADAAETSRLW